MNWQRFFEEVYQQRYVLVLGDEIMLEYDDLCKGDARRFILQAFKERDDEDVEKKDFIRQFLIERRLFNQSLESVLKKRLFRVIITTSVNDLLERVLREVWGDELRVLNFYDENDLPENEISRNNEFYDMRPTLYYAFGKATSNGVFVETEEDKLQAVANWLNHEHNKFPKRIYSYWSKKKLLAIGCKQDDWLFRFLWYSLRRDVKELSRVEQHLDGREYYGKVAIELNEDEYKLSKYLRKNGWLYETDARGFINDFNIQLTAESNTIGKMMIENNALGGCFISYAHEDFNIAMNIYMTLKQRGCRVWIDNEKLNPGDNYNVRIAQAISECKIFLPVLTKTILSDYDKGRYEDPEDKQRYYIKEWNLITKELDKDPSHVNIIPILCDGFDVGSMAYKAIPWAKEYDRTTFRRGQDAISKLINSINQITADDER